MAKTEEDILELKIPLGGVAGINLRALFRRFAKEENPDLVLVVAQRFLQIFNDHGVATSQIPRLIPGLSLEQLRTPESLLTALTPQVLVQTASLFQIRRKWLEGTSNIIYDCYYCYKDPWRFFEDLETLNVEDHGFPFVVFSSAKRLNFMNSRQQRLVPVLREECARLGDETIYRYRIYDDGWDWSYWKCRIQLKAMLRVWWMKQELPVPIFLVDKKELKELEEGRVVPHKYFWRRNRSKEESLEDFSLSPEESRVSREAEELPIVFEYIKAYKLDAQKAPTREERWPQETARFR